MRQNSRSVSLLMVIIILLLPVQNNLAIGAMIETSAILNASQIQQTRDFLKQLLTHNAVQNRLEVWGISPHDAAACIGSLTDAEIRRIAARIEDLPAGGGGGPWGIVGIGVIVAFVILLITDLLGYTDFFNIHKTDKD